MKVELRSIYINNKNNLKYLAFGIILRYHFPAAYTIVMAYRKPHLGTMLKNPVKWKNTSSTLANSSIFKF